MPRSKSLEAPKDHCRVCYRDFGVFLDIFRSLENRKYYKEIEECLSVKVSKQDHVSLKICHRCVYNLQLCSEFIQQSNTTRKQKTNPIVPGFCFFCLQNNCVLFDIESHVDEAKCTVCKIEKCFSSKVTNELNTSSKLCLSCTYRLDILYELRETALKTQKLIVKPFEENLLNVTDQKQTSYRNSHRLHLENYCSGSSPKPNNELHDVPVRKSGVKGVRGMVQDTKKIMRSVKENKMNTRESRSGKKVTGGQMKCSVELVDVMKVDRNKRKRLSSSGEESARKVFKVDEELKISRIATPVKPKRKSPLRTPVRTDIRSSRKTPVKSVTESPTHHRSRRTPVKTEIRSPRGVADKSVDLSPRKPPIRKSVKRSLQSSRTVKTNLLSKNKTKKIVNLKGRSTNQTANKRNTNRSGKILKVSGKLMATMGVKAVKAKFEHLLSNSQALERKERRNNAKFSCTVCNATFSKKFNLQEHELSHHCKMLVLVLKRCEETDTELKMEVPDVELGNVQVSTVSEILPEALSTRVAETSEDQKDLLAENIVGKLSCEEVESMDVCKDDTTADESKEDLNVIEEKENDTSENKNVCNIVSENNEVNGQNQESTESVLNDVNVVQELYNNESSAEQIEEKQSNITKGNGDENGAEGIEDEDYNTEGNKSSDEMGGDDHNNTEGENGVSELNPNENNVEINKNNNDEESPVCEETETTNKDIAENVEIHHSQNEFIEELSTSKEIKTDGRKDENVTDEINAFENLLTSETTENTAVAGDCQDNDVSLTTDLGKEEKMTDEDEHND